MIVGFVPSAFTSQMDSTTHKLYYVETVDENSKKKNKTKIVLADKDKVRLSQERHVNGQLTGYNAGGNITFAMENEVLRNEFNIKTKSGKDMYNTPAFDVKKQYKKNPFLVQKTYKKYGMYKVGTFENGVFVETESKKN